MQPEGPTSRPGGDSREIPLVGGRTTPGVVRVGETVRRPEPANSALLLGLFDLLATEGIEVAPRLLGHDDVGRLVTQWVEGVTTTHPSERREESYFAGARMLRRLHDVTAGHELAGAAECVAHGDPGPFNTVFQEGMPVVFIDWDSAAPGSRLGDLSYLGWTWCVQSQGGVPIHDQARRLAQVAQAYGDIDSGELLQGIAGAMQGMVDLADEQLARLDGGDGQRSHWQVTRDWAAGDLALFTEHRRAFERAVR